MTLNSTNTTNSPPNFRDGRLQPGIYKLQNIYTETYLDIEVHSREVVCRPIKDLGEGRGLWEIKPFGVGYTVQRFDPGGPEQFCTPLDGIQNGVTLRVGAYPVAWRLEIVEDENHRGFGFVRFYWGAKNIGWELTSGCKDNGARVQTYPENTNPWRIWRLVPVKVEGGLTSSHSSLETPQSGTLPSYEGGTDRSSTSTQHAESEYDELGTTVNEVTVVTTTITTRKKYRVEDA